MIIIFFFRSGIAKNLSSHDPFMEAPQRDIRWREALSGDSVAAARPSVEVAPETYVTRSKRFVRLVGGGKTSGLVRGLVATALTFVATLIVLVATAPPMVRRRAKTRFDAARRLSPAAVFGWSLAPAIAAGIVAGVC